MLVVSCYNILVEPKFLKTKDGRWVVIAPKRSARPEEAESTVKICPFCPGNEGNEEEVFRIESGEVLSRQPHVTQGSARSTEGFTHAPRDARPTTSKNQSGHRSLSESLSSSSDSKSVRPAFGSLVGGKSFGAKEIEAPRASMGTEQDSIWQVRVVKNKFPFAKIHEIVIHSPDHHKSFGELPSDQVELVLKTYQERFNFHKDHGQVYIFHNHGIEAGESLPHPHSQLVVVPPEVNLSIRPPEDYSPENSIESGEFVIFVPETSEWEDEVWVTSKRSGGLFGDITDDEINSLALTLQNLIEVMSKKLKHEFPFNFYIYPGENWYLRLVPRIEGIGGFEVGTGININVFDPRETLEFLKKQLTTDN